MNQTVQDLGLSRADLIDMYRTMLLIREFEETAVAYFKQGIVIGNMHMYVGEEATGVGVIRALEKEDYVASTHRCDGHRIAKGADINAMMAELMGRENGICGGRSGKMHQSAPEVGLLSSNGVVGASISQATGHALYCQMYAPGRVAVAFFGDGGGNQGALLECMNLASVWKLPVIYVCENNLYSANTSIRLTTLLENPGADRGSAYGMPGIVADGNDVLAVNEAMAEALARARSGEGPTIIEVKTYRKYGHSRNDACGYRPKEEEAWWFARDPVKCFRERLINENIASDEELSAIEEKITAEIEEAVEYAKNAPFPALESALEDVYAD